MYVDVSSALDEVKVNDTPALYVTVINPCAPPAAVHVSSIESPVATVTLATVTAPATNVALPDDFGRELSMPVKNQLMH